ncbi:DUF732 domain-containing protein [Mycobacterium sp. NPDC051804]|uniref:DUF732 domain-containing protein n=1 Tax=Mycobacterium sp. NPDC051804 TaxID=3364295 RepID=UPI00378F733E
MTASNAGNTPWPINAEPYYRPTLIGGLAATVGIMIGSVSPWLSVIVFTINGLDAGNWGITTLTLGALSGIALVVILLWGRTPFGPRWAVPLAWSVAVAAVACLTFGLTILIRLLAAPKTDLFGITIGPAVGWGLWLLTLSSAVLCATASIVAMQNARSVELLAPIGKSASGWNNGWRWAAIGASAVIAVAGSIWASVDWTDDSDESGPSSTEMPSFPSFPSFTGMPSIPSFPSFTPRPDPTSAAPQPLPTSTVAVPTVTRTPTVVRPGDERPNIDGADWAGFSRAMEHGLSPEGYETMFGVTFTDSAAWVCDWDKQGAAQATVEDRLVNKYDGLSYDDASVIYRSAMDWVCPVGPDSPFTVTAPGSPAPASEPIDPASWICDTIKEGMPPGKAMAAAQDRFGMSQSDAFIAYSNCG